MLLIYVPWDGEKLTSQTLYSLMTSTFDIDVIVLYPNEIRHNCMTNKMCIKCTQDKRLEQATLYFRS